jgi:hypothetical protein
MNCVEFESLITDLVRDEVLATGPREAALGHAQACARCGARLADEQTLTTGLRALSLAYQEEQAPWNVEAALRATFAQEQRPAPVRRRHLWIPATIAAAAVLAAGAGYRMTHRSTVSNRSVIAELPLRVEPPMEPAVAEEPPADAVEPAPSAVRPVRAARAIQRDGLFFPLLYGDDMSSLEAGRVVRVRLPGTALASFGVPVSEERRTERVEAEVLLGEDGLARAIRFEREMEY